MTVSLNLLTMGRSSAVIPTLARNLEQAGMPIDELVWCDNGSEWHEFSAIRDAIGAHREARGFAFTQIRHDRNQGVAAGYNRCAALSSSDLILITGCDRIMPQNWLVDLVSVMAEPQMACACVYSSRSPDVAKRYVGAPFRFEHLDLVPALPFEARLFRRLLLHSAGYLREDFGLYGWEDVEWGHRVLRVCQEQGLQSVNVASMRIENLGNAGHPDPEAYQAFKNEQAKDPAKIKLVQKCQAENYPFYSPY